MLTYLLSCLVFTSSVKREKRERNVQKSVMYVQSCFSANLSLLVLLFGRSRCRYCRRRCCLSSLLFINVFAL